MKFAVYCGSSTGLSSEYAFVSKKLGWWLAENHHHLIFGGGNIGLMGIIADAVLEKGGQAIGVMPTFLMQGERAHSNLTSFYEVQTMAERKQKMLDLSDICIALPGGPGTLEEIIEAISWYRINQSTNRCIFFNIDGYYDSLKEFFDNMVAQEFLDKEIFKAIHFVTSFNEFTELLETIPL